MSTDVFEDMRLFDQHFGLNVVDITPELLAFRMRFQIEELYESITALETGEYANFVDGMIDLMFVIVGTITFLGVDGQKAWSQVLHANMAKERGNNSSRHGQGDYDLVKPEGWKPPDHADNVGKLAGIYHGDFTKHFSHSVTVLFEAMLTQFKKNHDYDSKQSGIQRADYFIHGLDDFEYEINKKWLRIRSVLALIRAGQEPEFESLADSLQDIINYESFMVAWIRNMLEGQKYDRDLYNKKITSEAE